MHVLLAQSRHRVSGIVRTHLFRGWRSEVLLFSLNFSSRILFYGLEDNHISDCLNLLHGCCKTYDNCKLKSYKNSALQIKTAFFPRSSPEFPKAPGWWPHLFFHYISLHFPSFWFLACHLITHLFSFLLCILPYVRFPVLLHSFLHLFLHFLEVL